jgi:hypothetical protein
MPEASVDEYGFFQSRKNDVGPSWQIGSVKAVTVSHLKEQSPNGELGNHGRH